MKLRRTRIALGYTAGAIMVLSSGAHSLIGWPVTVAQLAKTDVPAELVQGLTIGWHLGGFCMAAFGIIVILQFTDLLRNKPVSLRPGLIVGIAYLTIGGWAIVYSGGDPFFAIFIVPGLMLTAASL